MATHRLHGALERSNLLAILEHPGNGLGRHAFQLADDGVELLLVLLATVLQGGVRPKVYCGDELRRAGERQLQGAHELQNLEEGCTRFGGLLHPRHHVVQANLAHEHGNLIRALGLARHPNQVLQEGAQTRLGQGPRRTQPGHDEGLRPGRH